jgi:hypothetical protein
MRSKPVTYASLSRHASRILQLFGGVRRGVAFVKLRGRALRDISKHYGRIGGQSLGDHNGLDAVHQAMDMATRVYEQYYDFLENEQLLLPTNGLSPLAQESFAFTDELPTDKVSRTTECWGFLESQETTAVAPDTFGPIRICFPELPANTSAAPREAPDFRLNDTSNPSPGSRIGAAEVERVARPAITPG